MVWCGVRVVMCAGHVRCCGRVRRGAAAAPLTAGVRVAAPGGALSAGERPVLSRPELSWAALGRPASCGPRPRGQCAICGEVLAEPRPTGISAGGLGW